MMSMYASEIRNEGKFFLGKKKEIQMAMKNNEKWETIWGLGKMLLDY